MKQNQYRLYAIQIDDDEKWVYVGFTHQTLEQAFQKQLSGTVENKSAKIFRKGHSGKLRPDITDNYPTYNSIDDARKNEIFLSEKLVALGYKVLSSGLKNRKKRSVKALFARNKSSNNKTSTKTAFEQNKHIDYRDEDNHKQSSGDVFRYGRKKSAEWNDEEAIKFQQRIEERIQVKKRNEID